MVRIEAPQQDRLHHTKHHRGQVSAPHAARAVIVLAAHNRVAQDALRRVIVHRHFRALDKDREAIPVVMQAAQDLFLDKVEVGIEKIRLTARLHLAHVGLQVAMALGKGRRLRSLRPFLRF